MDERIKKKLIERVKGVRELGKEIDHELQMINFMISGESENAKTSQSEPKGCGKRHPIKGAEEYFPTVGAVCGDNRMHEEGDEPNLCDECEKSSEGEPNAKKRRAMLRKGVSNYILNGEGCGKYLFEHPEHPEMVCECGDGAGYLCDECQQSARDELCKNCNKPKSKHIPCSTNDEVFWCYDNKKNPKRWAYQFELQDAQVSKSVMEDEDGK